MLCIGRLAAGLSEDLFLIIIIFTDYFRPLLVIGGSSERNQETMGAFQEFPQVPKLCELVIQLPSVSQGKGIPLARDACCGPALRLRADGEKNLILAWEKIFEKYTFLTGF